MKVYTWERGEITADVEWYRALLDTLEKAQARARALDPTPFNPIMTEVVRHLLATGSPIDGPYVGIGWRSLKELLDSPEGQMINTERCFGLTRELIAQAACEEAEAHNDYYRSQSAAYY